METEKPRCYTCKCVHDPSECAHTLPHVAGGPDYEAGETCPYVLLAAKDKELARLREENDWRRGTLILVAVQVLGPPTDGGDAIQRIQQAAEIIETRTRAAAEGGEE